MTEKKSIEEELISIVTRINEFVSSSDEQLIDKNLKAAKKEGLITGYAGEKEDKR